MKTRVWTRLYWGTTGVFAAMMTLSAWMYLSSEMVQQGFQVLGFPSYFRVELAVAKFLGAFALLAPVPQRLKEWAYAGFTITLISALVAHVAVGDSLDKVMGPVIAGVLLGVSYLAREKRAGQH